MRLTLPFFGRPRTGGAPEWLIVGLGNPGRQYAHSRHNVGFQVVSRLAEENGWLFDETRSQGLLARGRVGDVQVALLKPQTFMNLSGRSVAPVARFFKIPGERVLVAFDDVDLPLGKLRLRPGGGAGGHKGMLSIIEHLGTQQFPRLRIGIGRPAGQMPVEAYVLQDFRGADLDTMTAATQTAAAAIRAVVVNGFDAAMNEFNREAPESG